ncbi:hypothetical protein EI460_22295 [Salmonella enterica subsp. enterica]|uniref:hypothetical protein n=1 Tax=Salmonella enterica TaxID=28901 RepID=UPI00126CADF2|nr:hypothetical protein [Salmonella enterica]ECG1896409.1 hypothetical protein [Salmonella enterica subsp. enterica]EDT7242167.1 hypothetical protein [Salmonella enterica subsp. enterica serovar Warragul]EEA8305158.1 hypothetical protein [Salmonella enterica subsp. enterica serovar Rubislaw]EAT9710741.1 hypothetical protein [Salmonella enterica]EBO9896399.1 hypothetical protein [Salmonella enterica]
MNFKPIWDIWYPSPDKLSCQTSYTLEDAQQKLKHALEKNEQMHGTIKPLRVTVRYDFRRCDGRKLTASFNGRWHETPVGVTLEGQTSPSTFGPLVITIALLLALGMEILTLANLVGRFIGGIFFPLDNVVSGPEINWPLIVILLGFPPIFLAIATGILALLNAVEREQKQQLLRFIRDALK